MLGITSYIKDTIDEMLHKVTWPTWSELQRFTIVVVSASLLFSVMIFFMDYVVGISSSNGWKGLMGVIYNFFIS